MFKVLNRIVLVGSIVSLPFDIYGAIGGNETSYVWALLMTCLFIDAVRNELEWRNK